MICCSIFQQKSQQLPKLAVLCLQTMEIPRKRKPRLKEMIYCGLSILLAQRECQRSVDAVEANTFTNTHQFDFQCHDWDDIMKHYFEELLAFFFSKTRVSYNDEDCYTLLECMNSVNFPSGFNQVIITPQNISVLRYFLSRLLTHDKRMKDYDTLLNQFIVEVCGMCNCF